MTLNLAKDAAQTAGENQFRFESLVASICSSLANASASNVDGLVEKAMQQIAEALGGNRVLLGQADEKTGELLARAQYRSTEPPFPERLSITELNPALWQTLVSGDVANVPDVAAIPDSHTVDRTYFQRIDLRSFLAVPVIIDGALRFMLAVGSAGVRRDWPEEAVPRLRILAEVLACALLRCEAEEVVRASEQLFRSFVEDATVPIMLAPGPDQTPLYFNPALTRLFGYTREDLPTPAAWWPRAYPDLEYRADRIANWEKVVAAGECSGKLQDSEVAEMRAKDGSTRYCEIRLSLVRGHKLIFFNDLTARREAEAALRLTQFAVDHTPLIVFRIDLEGKFVYANEAACREFGFSRVELAAKHMWDISATLSADQWPQRVETARERGSLSLESVYRRRDESTFPVELHIHHVQFSGLSSFFVFALDISVRRAAQEAAHGHFKRVQALARELSRSEERQRRELARILHDDIGQNLFAITTQLLALQNRLPGEKEALGKVLGLLDSVTHDTRELTSELCPPILYQLGLGPALQRLADHFSKTHNIAVKVEGGGAGPADLNIRGLVYHTVRELLNNVAKHSRASRVGITISQPEELLSICVEDNGIGYNPAEASRKSGGFGLFYLRERISLLGGNLVINSAPGAGCRVMLELPFHSSRPE